MKTAWIPLAAVCALVVGVYVYATHPGVRESLDPHAADAYYNLLVQGFRAGQLNLKKEVPPGLAQLADPYNPTANAPYRAAPYELHDLSYYQGKLYLYWGVTPALLLFWPYVALTGHYLSHSHAVTIFCAIGFLVGAGLLCALWRRYFVEVNVAVVAACALALGLASGVPILLSRSDVYEVPISCAYMLTMLALAALWRAFHEPERRCQLVPTREGWLAAASAAYGLAVGARPSLLFGAVILLVPVIQTWRERQPGKSPNLPAALRAGLAAAVPIGLIGLGLMLYNARRFGSPFEFGVHYQLNEEQMPSRQFFSLRYFWFDFRLYFLEPARWSALFPFVHDVLVPPLPPGYVLVEKPFGVLTNIPLVWLALMVPLAWRDRPPEAASVLRSFVVTAALFFVMAALTLVFYQCAIFRYEVDFLPALVLLAVVGILGTERALADQPARRRAVRWGWGLLLGLSVAFNLFANVESFIQTRHNLGIALIDEGRLTEAVQVYEETLRIAPHLSAAHYNLGVALARLGRKQEAMAQWEQALQLDPDNAEAHYRLGFALSQASRTQEAIAHYEQALRIKPDFTEARTALDRLQAGQ